VERRRLLEELVAPGPSVQVPTAFPSGGAALLDAARAQGLEGVVAKRADSTYVSGGRSDRWRKVKVRNEQEFVVCGWLGGTGARADSIGSLVLGCHRDGELSWVGNVGTGFTGAELRRIADLLAPIAVDACPFAVRPPAPTGSRARWVRPTLVVEVAFGEWTGAGRLRHPAYLGRRDDKLAADVTCDP
jgi:bifunctional non-homologous end joining protein LigD